MPRSPYFGDTAVEKRVSRARIISPRPSVGIS